MKCFFYRSELKISFSEEMHRSHFTFRGIMKSDAMQRVSDSVLSVTPPAEMDTYDDVFSNTVIFGSIAAPHKVLTFTQEAKVVTGMSRCLPLSSREPLHLYRFQSRLTVPGETLEEFRKSLPARRKEIALERALIITEEIYAHMNYVKGITGTATSAEDAFASRMGVCQDYTHILLSLLRSEGYAARYVCGIFPGSLTSHAWAEVLHNGIWIGIDPVNMKLCDDTYAVLARGADSSDTLLNKGVFFGSGQQHMQCTYSLEEQ